MVDYCGFVFVLIFVVEFDFFCDGVIVYVCVLWEVGVFVWLYVGFGYVYGFFGFIVCW